MITRRMWQKGRDKAARRIERMDERRGTLTLVSWIWPDAKRHPRFYRRLAAETRFNLITNSKGMVKN